MFCVIFGHLIEPLIEKDTLIKSIYLSIYSFHMPAFVIMSGFFAKSELKSEYISKIVYNLLIPLMVFTVFYEMFDLLVEGKISSYTRNLQPYWILWFLFSLILWKLFIPIILKFKYPVVLSVVIALLAGYAGSIGYFLGLSRTIYFFPFFVAGYKLIPSYLSMIKFKSNSVPYIIVSVTIILLNLSFFFNFNEIDQRWLYGCCAYEQLGSYGLMAAIIRSILYVISFISVLAIFILIPNQEIPISRKGRNSLYAYVWHGIIVKILFSMGVIYTIGNLNEIVSLFLLFFISVLLMTTLSTNILKEKTEKFILQPIRNLLLIRS